MMSETQVKEMVSAALAARERAYAPYSHFKVGAALLTDDGKIYSGCNVENASFGATNCAERTAVFKAVSEGELHFRAIAIAGGMEGSAPKDYVYPCGICRQVLGEFGEPDFEIYLVKSSEDYKVCLLNDLLPNGFGGASIQ